MSAADKTVTEIDTGPSAPAAAPAPAPAHGHAEVAYPSSHGTHDADVLRQEEDRKRSVAITALSLSYAISAIVLGLLPDAWQRFGALLVLLAANALLCVVLWFVARRRSYPDLISAGMGMSASLTALTAAAYFGVASAAIVGMPILIYYFGMADSPLRRSVVAFLIAGYVVISILTLIRVIPVWGLALPHDASPSNDLGATAATAVVVAQMFAFTYWLARKSRRSTLLAMQALEQARLKIGQRDALLREAHADLDRVMAGVRKGRYTDSAIGPFEVGDVIGRGAIGEVYEARHRESGEAVAVKVLHAHLQDEGGQVQRFFREVQITGSLRSPHIPATLGSGFTADGGPYLAMELLAGTDLATDLRQRKLLPLPEIDAMVEQIARGLHVAHASGVVHRDIKPQNLFRTTTEPRHWKILDFGVSKLVTGSGTLTRGAAIGTPGYMSPEQVAGADIDARADVFALAAVTYRAVTGRPAFSGSSELVTMMRVARTQPARPSDFADVPAQVELLLCLGLAKDPELRIPSAAAFATGWIEARRGKLDGALRKSAEHILAEHPWGSDVELEEKTTVLAR